MAHLSTSIAISLLVTVLVLAVQSSGFLEGWGRKTLRPADLHSTTGLWFLVGPLDSFLVPSWCQNTITHHDPW